ncbi:flagellar hook-basal body complex protein FliE [Clostridium puniceum]|uniref:Flagellar hook-basal body complex protein FliE n=1 Tax=Clostridium puniceum TaxID=29367 RepID=A0A1S8TBN3_9CLOT|nr:flagellar hook-basal body complex protein FliE [Clostridium puniceum]OOM75021.1 flagellar hook-basal body complex protein FliE [Clostridium puniceum]
MRIEDKFAQTEAIFNSKFNGVNNDKKADEKTELIGFSDILKKCVNDTNGKISEANSVTNSFVKGEDVNIDEVMVKGQEASLSLQFLTQTRDKLLEGYNQLSRLQL